MERIHTLRSGKVIKVVPEINQGSCVVCVGYTKKSCDEIHHNIDCKSGFIAVPYEEEQKSAEQKYTVKEVLEAYSEFSGVHVDSIDIVSVRDELNYKMDPEYKEYLRLKEKFDIVTETQRKLK